MRQFIEIIWDKELKPLPEDMNCGVNKVAPLVLIGIATLTVTKGLQPPKREPFRVYVGENVSGWAASEQGDKVPFGLGITHLDKILRVYWDGFVHKDIRFVRMD